MRYFLFCLLFPFLSIAQHTTTLDKVIGKTTYPFWVQNSEDKKPQSLIIFLHGRSLRGTNMNSVKRYGILYAMARGKKIPGIVVAPQLASGSWDPDKVLELLEYVKKNYNVDEKRIYVCGMSLGGYGTLHFAGKYPEKITAAVGICGGGNRKDACRLGQLPLWIIHGNNDRAVPLSESEKIVRSIRNCTPDAPLEFTIVPGGTHGSVERYFHGNELYDWLFMQKKSVK